MLHAPAWLWAHLRHAGEMVPRSRDAVERSGLNELPLVASCAYDASMVSPPIAQERKSRTVPIVIGTLGSAASLFLFPVAFVFAASSGQGGVANFFQEGGWGAWVILLLGFLASLVTIALSIWLTAKTKAWSWTMAIMPLLVGLSAALLERLSMSHVIGAVAGESVDPAVKARILGVGSSEVLVLSILGGLAVTVLFSSGAAVFGARALSRVDRPGFGAPAIGAFITSVLGLIAVAAIALLVPSFRESPFGFGWFPAFATALAGVLAGVAISSKDASAEDRARAIGDLVIACAYGLGGVVVASSIVHALGLRISLAALGGESIDPSMAGSILSDGLADAASAPIHLVYAVPVLLVLVGVLAASIRSIGRPVLGAAPGAITALVSAGLVTAMFYVPRGSRVNLLVEMNGAVLPADLSLPEVPRVSDRMVAPDVVLGKSDVLAAGTRVAGTAELDSQRCNQLLTQLGENDYRTPAMAVDEAVAFDRVACIWKGLSKEDQRVDVLVRMADMPPLPPPWDALGAPRGIVTMTFAGPSARRPANHVHLSSAKWEARIRNERMSFEGSLEARMQALFERTGQGPLGVSSDPEVPFVVVVQMAANHRDSMLTIDVHHDKESLLSVLEAPAGGLGLSGGFGVGAGDSAGGARIRAGATTVSGRLPAEVIQRIVRQNFGRLRLCYEQGLTTNPHLSGRVNIRFVIAADGSVASAADAGSDLPDGKVVACVAKAFSAMSFPRPDGGIVMVSYPIMFTPNCSATGRSMWLTRGIHSSAYTLGCRRSTRWANAVNSARVTCPEASNRAGMPCTTSRGRSRLV